MLNYLLWGKLEGVCHSADYILIQVKIVELKIFLRNRKTVKCELFQQSYPYNFIYLHSDICLSNLDYSFLANGL